MANRYWVGGGATNDWGVSSPTNWSTSSGGSNNASVPGSSDNAFFDGNSGSPTITTVNSNVFNLDTTGFTGTIGSGVYSIYGSLTVGSGTTINSSGSFIFLGTSSHTINTNGVNIQKYLEFSGTGTYTLNSNLTHTSNSGLLMYKGTFDANDYNVSAVYFASVGSDTKNLYMGNGTWTMTGQNLWSTPSSTNITVYSEASTLVLDLLLTGNRTLNGGDRTFYNFWDKSTSTSTYSLTINGGNTFNELKLEGDADKTIKFEGGKTQTVTTFTPVSSSSNNLIMDSVSGTWTISKSSGTVNVSYCNIKNSTATGGATWNASNGTNIDSGGNSGWIFGQQADFFNLF